MMHQQQFKPGRLLMVVFLLFAVLFPTACIEIKQELWINNDGSGRVLVDFGVSSQFYQLASSSDDFSRKQFDQRKKKLAKKPFIKDVKFRMETKGDMRHLIYDIRVTDVTKLNKKVLGSLFDRDTERKNNPGDMGGLTVKRKEDGNYLVKFHMEKDKEEDEQDGDNNEDAAGNMMAKSMFAGRDATFIVHGPEIVRSSGHVNEKRTRAKQVIPISDMMADSYNLTFETEVRTGTPAWLLAGGILFGTLIIGGLVYLWIRTWPIR